MDTYQALRVLNVKQDSSQIEIKTAYRKLALELHPDRNKDKEEDVQFKKITEAYNHLKKNHNQNNNSIHQEFTESKSTPKTNFKRKPQGGAPGDKKFLNKIGVNIPVNLKRETLIFGKNTKVNSGKNTMHVFDQMVKMENMTKQKNLTNNQTFSLM